MSNALAGLLPLLKSIHKPCHLRKFKGQTLGVDAYGWLHRGTVSCAIDLALDKPVTKYVFLTALPSSRGIDWLTTHRYVDFAMHRVRMLIHFGVTPYIVFDGDHLPSKAAEELERATRREESKKVGLELYRIGKTSQAHQELQKAVDVTPYMARLFIEELKKLDVQYVVAPYEADAQLVYLERKGLISGILSEDSDMLVFGAKRLLTKLEQYGDCVEINRVDFTACRDISLIGWTDADFRRMAILSGCDYLANIKNMGIKTAYRYVRRYKSIEKVLQMLQFEGKYYVPAGYLEDFKQAELTFLHQRVFCPMAQQMVMLTELNSKTKEEDLPFVGAPVEKEIAIGVSCGDLDPMTKEPIVLRPKLNSSFVRRRTVAADSDLKKMKQPIDSFFKRMPLGELDPNSLEPLSPSQLLLVENANNTSWYSSPAPPLPGNRRSRISLPANRPSPSPLVRSAHRNEWLARAATIPEPPQTTKRQRLCSDADDSIIAADGTAKSRFFPSKASDPSPLPRKKGGNKKAKKVDANIWSDDSIDEALSLIPDISDSVKPQKFAVFADEGKGGACKGVTIAQEENSQTSTLVSENSLVSNFTADTSLAGSFDGDELLEEVTSNSKEEMSKLAQQFKFGQSKGTPKQTVLQEVRTPQQGKSDLKHREGAVALEKLKVATPLQRSKTENLLHRHVFASEVQKFGSVGPQTRARHHFDPVPDMDAPSTIGDSTSGMPNPEFAQEVERFASVKRLTSTRIRGDVDNSAVTIEEGIAGTPTPEISHVKCAVVARGSEDLLVPNSEDEDVEPASDEEERTRPALSIGKFLFTPK